MNVVPGSRYVVARGSTRLQDPSCRGLGSPERPAHVPPVTRPVPREEWNHLNPTSRTSTMWHSVSNNSNYICNWSSSLPSRPRL